MKKKTLLLLFILSFICVIYTINSICYQYIDNRIDTLVLTQFIHIDNANNIFQYLNSHSVHINIINENTRLLITLTVSIISLLIFTVTNKFQSLLYIVALSLLYITAYKICLDKYIFINLIGVLVSILLSKYFANTYLQIFKNNVNKKIENVLSKYISKDIKNKILKNTSAMELGGKKQNISVMFADIRGFTSLSETRKAEEVSQLLNEYFSELEPIITKYNGVINKFIGDAVLVVFGDPTQDKNHPKTAVKCAYELKLKVKEIKERWITEGKPKIDIGVGINTGDAFIGNVGTKERFEYTVIGDTVNIASRIEDYNKIYKTHILISEDTYNKISNIVDVIKIREVSIKGKSKK